MINARDFNGEVMMNIVLKYFPQKVNQDLFRQTLMDKYESQILKITSMEQIMGTAAPANHYKLVNAEAVQNYVASQLPAAGGAGSAVSHNTPSSESS